MKHYTFEVHVSFKMQYTFTKAEIVPDSEGADGAVEPTSEALRMLEEALQMCLGKDYVVQELEASTDADLIMHCARQPVED